MASLSTINEQSLCSKVTYSTEHLTTFAIFRQTPYAIHANVDHLLAYGIVTSGVIVGRVLFAGQKLFRKSRDCSKSIYRKMTRVIGMPFALLKGASIYNHLMYIRLANIAFVKQSASSCTALYHNLTYRPESDSRRLVCKTRSFDFFNPMPQERNFCCISSETPSCATIFVMMVPQSPTIQFPTGIADLYASLTDVDADNFALKHPTSDRFVSIVRSENFLSRQLSFTLIPLAVHSRKTIVGYL
uniref:Uncharacterized protein n=1 Tax=Romanomermis culicivorax TaxID=13658 RepID=A0A915JK66_ROMCU